MEKTAEKTTAKYSLPKLPYALDALAPELSKEALEFHYGKHHQAYCNNLNTLIAGTSWESMSLEDIIRKADGGLFNNAAQFWNHNVYWESLTPKPGKAPAGDLLQALNKHFGSLDKFKEAFTKSATTLFGSGWTWLVKKQDGSLAIRNTNNADDPLKYGEKTLLTCDVWEHAYYIDYRNARPKYMDAYWALVNWDYAAKNLAAK
ncbi:MAG: superoxide dismutase [Fe] [Elusimicrobia bacterium]|nr:superoxide dismutase [Fe] [Elusimicrobiota bacterium]MDE2313616.1 superoxide dismutase [Fe] [Elusimicrobiota bacterium]